MRTKLLLLLTFAAVCFPSYSQAQMWSAILDPSRAIDWSIAGIPGGIPNRTTVCATVNAGTYGNGSSDATSGIQTALNNCPAGQVVALSAGTFRINSGFSIPSNKTLRGAGAGSTILDLRGSSTAAINLGNANGPDPSNATSITSGASSGSTSIGVSSASGISVGMYLLINGLNDSSIPVTQTGKDGTCDWCDLWNGTRAQGQIVEVTSVSGTTIGISPSLYRTYSGLSPLAVPFSAGAKYAGVENLQLYANNTGYAANILLSGCAYCWVKGVHSNFTDGDHIKSQWSYRLEIRDNYVHDGFNHSSGQTESMIMVANNTSASLVENNILIRTHVSIMLNWGAAGNVIAYNYSYGHYHDPALNFQVGDLSMHGAHPSFNLFEGNNFVSIYLDAIWGSNSHNTVYRNLFRGASRVFPPYSTRGAYQTGSGFWTYQADRAEQLGAWTRATNLVGNLTGSADVEAANVNGFIALCVWPCNRDYQTAYGATFGYGGSSDDGTAYNQDNASPYTTALIHGEYNDFSHAITWANGLTQTLPASFYRASKPAWFGSITWPPIGPDVSSGPGPGGHAYAIPAEACYTNTPKDSNGFIQFEASNCYPQSVVAPAAPTNLTVK